MIRTAIVSLFATCTMRCAYCDMAETGQVLDRRQLEPFKHTGFITRAADFFNSRTTDNEKWLLLLTGGEPLVAPNLDMLCNRLFSAGNSVAIYTNLHVGPNHPSWKFLLESSYPNVDYITASFHPETEQWENEFFERVRILKERGHRIIIRFVGHPQRLARLSELSEKCRELDVCFYPSAMLSSEYPRAYTHAERNMLEQHFSSLGQFIQMEGGIDTTNTLCHAGNKLIWVDLQSGNVTPCVTVTNQIIGNIHRNELSLFSQPIPCPQAGINCSCLSHFQHDIVIGAEDHAYFTQQKAGSFVPPLLDADPLASVRANGIKFYAGSDMGLGRKADTQLLVFPKQHVKANYRRNILGLTDDAINQTTDMTDSPSRTFKSLTHRLKGVLRRVVKKK